MKGDSINVYTEFLFLPHEEIRLSRSLMNEKIRQEAN